MSVHQMPERIAALAALVAFVRLDRKNHAKALAAIQKLKSTVDLPKHILDALSKQCAGALSKQCIDKLSNVRPSDYPALLAELGISSDPFDVVIGYVDDFHRSFGLVRPDNYATTRRVLNQVRATRDHLDRYKDDEEPQETTDPYDVVIAHMEHAHRHLGLFGGDSYLTMRHALEHLRSIRDRDEVKS
jgi:hypothetical protein